MPIYEFYCTDCHETFDTRRSLAESDAPATCPTCGQTHARRVVSSFVAFAGSGTERRAVAGSSGCAGCAPSPGGCAGCGVRH